MGEREEGEERIPLAHMFLQQSLPGPGERKSTSYTTTTSGEGEEEEEAFLGLEMLAPALETSRGMSGGVGASDIYYTIDYRYIRFLGDILIKVF